MKLYRSVVAAYHNVFNIKFALISAAVNGPLVVLFNLQHGPSEYLYAGGWQAAMSFFSTGITARVIQHFSLIAKPVSSYFWGTTASALLTFAGSATVHWFNGTPELWMSCLTPTLISYTTAFGTNFITRRGLMLPANYPKRHK